MISKEEILKISKLARLELSTEEVENMQKDLSEILDYFNSLKSVSSKNITKTKALKEKNELRKDEPVKNSKAEGMIQDKDKKEGYIKVKSIL